MDIAFYGRVSTEKDQQPHLSIPRQVEAVKKCLRPEDKLILYFWDIESGSKNYEDRGNGFNPPYSILLTYHIVEV